MGTLLRPGHDRHQRLLFRLTHREIAPQAVRLTVEQKASHLSHAAVIHSDITTADAEFDIFMGITKEDVRRVARTYFNEENRLVLTILPPASAGRSFLRPGGDQ